MEDNSFNFVTRHTDPNGNETLVMTISDKGVWVNPELEVDDAAEKVIEALQNYILSVVKDAVLKEREECAQICEDHFSSDGDWCAKAIRGRE